MAVKTIVLIRFYLLFRQPKTSFKWIAGMTWSIINEYWLIWRLLICVYHPTPSTRIIVWQGCHNLTTKQEWKIHLALLTIKRSLRNQMSFSILFQVSLLQKILLTLQENQHPQTYSFIRQVIFLENTLICRRDFSLQLFQFLFLISKLKLSRVN